MIASLQELVAPLTVAEFVERLSARKLTFLHGSDPSRFDGLLDWNTLLGLAESGAFPAGKLRVTRDRDVVPPPFYLEAGRLDAARFAMLARQGVSLIAEPLDRHVPALAALCADIRAAVPEDIKAGAIATTGAGGAFKLHYDPEDLVILQIEGTKRWRIHGPPVENPVRGMAERAPPQGEPVFDQVLGPGDLLFVPAGHWHQCENGPGRSLHLGIFIRPPTGWYAARAILTRLREDELFRAPLSRLGGPERTAHEAALRARLIEAIAEMPFTGTSSDDDQA